MEEPTQETQSFPRIKVPPGRPSKLRWMMEMQPDVYEAMMRYLRLGATPSAVAAAIGLHPRTIYMWISKGRKAKTSSIYRKFYDDVVHAVGHASVVVEAKIKLDQPMAWLRYGPRRLLDDQWRDDAEIQVGIEHHDSTQHDDSRAPVSDKSVSEALLELRNAGIIDFKGAYLGDPAVTVVDDDNTVSQEVEASITASPYEDAVFEVKALPAPLPKAGDDPQSVLEALIGRHSPPD